MAEGSAHSRYVKLTKDQGPLEDIKPGELNQPIEVPQVFSLSLSLSVKLVVFYGNSIKPFCYLWNWNWTHLLMCVDCFSVHDLIKI